MNKLNESVERAVTHQSSRTQHKARSGRFLLDRIPNRFSILTLSVGIAGLILCLVMVDTTPVDEMVGYFVIGGYLGAGLVGVLYGD